MTYNMQQQLAKGEEAELLLDRHFSDRFTIEPATRDQQRQGIDRIFTKTVSPHPGSQSREVSERAQSTAKSYFIEYKTDWTAGRTGNAFIETVSVDTMNVLGWVYTSQSEWLIYYIPIKLKIYIVRFSTLREQLDLWIERYGPEKAIPNNGYFTRGITVPIREFAECASKIEELIDTRSRSS